MTGQTRLTHFRTVICNETRILDLVAIDTRGKHGSRFVLAALCRKSMTRAAGQLLTSIVALVARERKAKLIVRQVHERCLRQAGRPAPVIWMTRGTFLWTAQMAVQSLRIRHLILHIDVAIQTARAIRPLKRGVAPVTARFEIRVCCHVRDRTVLCVFSAERTRIERRTAVQDNSRGQANDQSDGRPTAYHPS